MQELTDIQEDLRIIDFLKKEFKELKEISNLDDEKLVEELEHKINELRNKIEEEETKIFLSGKYDKGNAVLSIFAGAGGQDSQDWVTLLLRMYERYLLSEGYKTKIISQSFGEGGGPEGRIGTKEVSLEVKGRYAYGILKKEMGTHRLVRLSPFSSKQIRHTSFAQVDIYPEIDEKLENIKINPDDLKVDTYRSSGPGGQNVNKRETAIRITHIPTGLVANSQTERSQGINREKAMKLLLAKLYKLEEDKREKEIKKIKEDKTSPSWGNQIRNYVFHPYKMVKDLRTGIETSNVEGVLNGDIKQFINSGIKLN